MDRRWTHLRSIDKIESVRLIELVIFFYTDFTDDTDQTTKRAGISLIATTTISSHSNFYYLFLFLKLFIRIASTSKTTSTPLLGPLPCGSLKTLFIDSEFVVFVGIDPELYCTDWVWVATGLCVALIAMVVLVVLVVAVQRYRRQSPHTFSQEPPSFSAFGMSDMRRGGGGGDGEENGLWSGFGTEARANDSMQRTSSSYPPTASASANGLALNSNAKELLGTGLEAGVSNGAFYRPAGVVTEFAPDKGLPSQIQPGVPSGPPSTGTHIPSDAFGHQ